MCMQAAAVPNMLLDFQATCAQHVIRHRIRQCLFAHCRRANAQTHMSLRKDGKDRHSDYFWWAPTCEACSTAASAYANMRDEIVL